MNILEPILFQARYRPGGPALCAPGVDLISYERLVAQINNIARSATGLGLAPGSVVALSIDQSLLHATAILGLTAAGMIPVSVGGQAPPPGLKIDAVISNATYPFAPDVRHFLADFSWLSGSGLPVKLLSGQNAADENCRIVLTAGTTGEAKAVALTHRMVLARNARFDHVLGARVPTFARFYLHMGLAAALSYQFLIHVLGRGGTVFLPGESMENTLRACEIFKIDAMLSTPTALSQLVDACDRNPSIAFHVDTIISGGSLLRCELADRLRPRFCAHLITGYGSTETAISATAPVDQIAQIIGAAGYVTPGMRFEIVGEDDQVLPANTEGIVRIASEFAVDGYIDDPAETARAFRGKWFYPGDLGSLTQDNLLIISGRQNAVLNVGGDKVTAEKIEAALLSYQGVREAAVFMATDDRGGEEIRAAVVCSKGVDSAALQEFCKTQMPSAFVPRRIDFVQALPINAVGKIDRTLLREMISGQTGGAS